MSPLPLRSTFGRSKRFQEIIFSVCGALSSGAAPLSHVCTFSIFLSRRMTDPWRLLSRPMVQSSLSKSRIFFPTKTSLMVPGLSMLPYRGITPFSDGGRVFVSFVVSWSTPCLQSLCRSRPQVGKLPYQGQMQKVWENRALCTELYL